MSSLPNAPPLEVHLLAHTHWDREWYRPAVQFRQRLVALIDELLGAPSSAAFLLDGQAVVLDDYLDVRPERASDLSAMLRKGALEAGPWYVLPDEQIPGGEALVRNLLAGRRVLRRLRAQPPPVLYCPDSFGHPASLATIASEFGCPVTIVWRGYGGARWPRGDTVRWRGPDGATTLLFHLPPAGYEAGAHLPLSDEAARGRWAALRHDIVERSSLGVVLLPHGADHHALQRDDDEAVAALGRAMGSETLVRSSLTAFAARLVERAAGRRLPMIEGELRESYGYTWTLQGTLGVRSALKRRNAGVERLLVRDAEPWAALARLREGWDSRALLHSSWRSVLLCHPHDTLCGCSIDAVARAVASRLEEAEAAAEGVRDAALDVLAGHDPVAARSASGEWLPVAVVRNPSARRRSGVTELELDVVLAEVPVGPGSAASGPPPSAARAVSLGDPAVVVQTLSRRRTFAREESPQHYPQNRLVERRRVLSWVDQVPAYGMRLLPIRPGARRPVKPPEAARATRTTIENGKLQVAIDGEDLTLVGSDGQDMPSFLSFEAEGEQGDLYTRSEIEGTRTDARFVRARVSMRGPLRAAITANWELELAGRRLTTAAGTARVAPWVRIPIRAVFELDAGAPFVRIRVAGDNRATDVRIRACIRTPLVAPRVFADAAYGIVERRRLDVPASDAAAERPVPTAPLHRYVSLFSGARGCTIFSDGLAEYETTLAGDAFITLLRAVGDLSRASLAERPGHAGWPEETPEAQAPGRFEALLAVMPHGPRRPGMISQIDHVADDVLLPLTGNTWRTALSPPGIVEGAQLVGRGLSCCSIKESDDGEWIVLRCLNLFDDAVPGAWRVPGAREARLSRLDETPLGALAVRNGVIAFEAPPRGVVTILVR